MVKRYSLNKNRINKVLRRVNNKREFQRRQIEIQSQLLFIKHSSLLHKYHFFHKYTYIRSFTCFLSKASISTDSPFATMRLAETRASTFFPYRPLPTPHAPTPGKPTGALSKAPAPGNPGCCRDLQLFFTKALTRTDTTPGPENGCFPGVFFFAQVSGHRFSRSKQ